MSILQNAKKVFEKLTGHSQPNQKELNELLIQQQPEIFYFKDDGETPNNPLNPVIYYPSSIRLIPQFDSASVFESLFAENNWKNSWRNGIYDFLHFHTNSHEVLGIACGQAQIQLGGKKGRMLEIKAGDVLILPAGTGHCCLSKSRDLLVVGAYPDTSIPYDQPEPGQISHAVAIKNIARVKMPEKDPVYGKEGALLKYWGKIENMSIILYNHEAGSTSSQKVRLCLRYKGLDYESVNIDLDKHQNQGSDYLKINRHGLVPTLVHDTHVIQEANLINEYLDRVFKEKPLLSQDPLLLYQIQYLCKRQEYINEQCFRYLSYKRSGRANTLTAEQIENHPQLDRRRFLRELKNGLSDENILEIENYLVTELEYLNAKLSKYNWLCGNYYTLADLSWTVSIYRLEELGKINLLHDHKLNHLIDWYAKVKNMDNFVVMHI
jgi:uncharacterized protein YjlB/glutathione S-transferase